MSKVTCRKRNDSWSYRFLVPAPEGKRKEVTRSGYPTKKEAYTAGIMAMRDYTVTGRVPKLSTMLYADLLDKWLASVRVDVKESSYDTYKNNVDTIIKPRLGMIQLSQLDTAQLQNVLDDLFLEQYARTRLVCIKSNLTASLRYAKHMGYIQNNPAVELTAPGKTENARDNVDSRCRTREVVPADVWQRIIQRFPEGTSCHLPMVLAYRCGLRRGEAFGLTWDNVDFEKSVITVDHQVQYSRGTKSFRVVKPKYGSKRTIEVDRETMELLRRTRARQEENRERYGDLYLLEYVDGKGYINEEGRGTETSFVNTEEWGAYISHFKLQHTLKVIQGKAKGCEEAISPTFDFHSLRHTHTTMLLEAGLDVKYVSERLGHKDIQTTLDIYTHLTDRMREANRSKLDALYTE
jgi:integrase